MEVPGVREHCGKAEGKASRARFRVLRMADMAVDDFVLCVAVRTQRVESVEEKTKWVGRDHRPEKRRKEKGAEQEEAREGVGREA